MVDSTDRRPLEERTPDLRDFRAGIQRRRNPLTFHIVCLALSFTFAYHFHADTAHANRPAPAHAVEAFRTEILPLNWKFFVEIGRCEQPGDGRWGINWKHPGPTYPGGLGVFAPLWTEDGIDGTDLAPTIPEATPIEQMIHAQRIIDKYGVYAWGCTGVALANAPFYE